MEMPDTVLIGRLLHYGKVFSFCRNRIANGMYNGVCTAKIHLNLPIPRTIFVASKLIWIWYPTQPKMCRLCGDPGHIAAKCSSVRCFNCATSGHRIEDSGQLPPLLNLPCRGSCWTGLSFSFVQRKCCNTARGVNIY